MSSRLILSPRIPWTHAGGGSAITALSAAVLSALICLPSRAQQAPSAVQAFEPAADVQLTGDVVASSIHIRAGVQVRAHGPVSLFSSGDIVIEGSLASDTVGPDGGWLRLVSGSRIVILGDIVPSEGLSATQSGARGGDAGDLVLEAPLVLSDRDLVGGPGGRGGPAGRGGAGGSIWVLGPLLPALDPARGVKLFGGPGGDGGPGFESDAAMLRDGGDGGPGGAARILPKADASGDDGDDGDDGEDPGDDGDDGSDGADATATFGMSALPGGLCSPGGFGGAGGSATGGKGGGGGDGADGNLTHKNGGNGGKGASGGDATGGPGGTGGAGGSCCYIFSGTSGPGGVGGNGGAGGNATGGAGGDGGDGGDGRGLFGGGDGGNGGNAGNGGDATSGSSGSGGTGGIGIPGGPGGFPGFPGVADGGNAGEPGDKGGGGGASDGSDGDGGSNTTGPSGASGSGGSFCMTFGGGLGGLGTAGLKTGSFTHHPTFVNLGHGLNWSHHPTLGGHFPLGAGDQVRLDLRDGPPGGATCLIIGLTQVLSPFKGGVLVPSPDVRLGPLPIGADGALSLQDAWPADLLHGTKLYLQHWMTDSSSPTGYAASNALEATTP